MKDILGIVLVAGGAYLAYVLYENYVASQSVSATPAGSAPLPPATPATPTPVTPPSTTAPAPTMTTPPVSTKTAITSAQLIARALQDGVNPASVSNAVPGPSGGGPTLPANPVINYNVWQWNYIMKELFPAAANLNTSNNAALMTADQYVAARQSAGLSGFGGLGARRVVRMPRNYVHASTPMLPRMVRRFR